MEFETVQLDHDGEPEVLQVERQLNGEGYDIIGREVPTEHDAKTLWWRRVAGTSNFQVITPGHRWDKFDVPHLMVGPRSS
ncbi:MAG: hypothetical protein JWQ89_4314 [Devosia sp.]|nr:hypothetical protein [Devosia sp.]